MTNDWFGRSAERDVKSSWIDRRPIGSIPTTERFRYAVIDAVGFEVKSN